MRTLHIVQGGTDNGDKKWLERAAKAHLTAPSWVVPKSVAVGDDVVIYIRGHGFFATGRITSVPEPRTDWKNRYGAGLGPIKLITPSISLGTIRRRVPALTWAIYPRSITTPPIDLANQIRDLIIERRRTGTPDFTDEALEFSSIEELRKVALLAQRRSVTARERKVLYRARSVAIRRYVLLRAKGRCEGCKVAAPFRCADGSFYLEAHHVERLADDGPDHPRKVQQAIEGDPTYAPAYSGLADSYSMSRLIRAQRLHCERCG